MSPQRLFFSGDQFVAAVAPCNWQCPAGLQTALGASIMLHVEISWPAAISARRAVRCRSTRGCNTAALVATFDHGKYVCGPPQALAPIAITWHWALLLQAASPISSLINASNAVALSGLIGAATPGLADVAATTFAEGAATVVQAWVSVRTNSADETEHNRAGKRMASHFQGSLSESVYTSVER